MTRWAPVVVAFVVALVVGCRTEPIDFDLSTDLSLATELVPDQSMVTVAPDASCAPPSPNDNPCPCGMSGLCQPATGRLSVQTQTGTQLQLAVMDDNGCNRTTVATDQPIGVPRWAPDGERLAYLTAPGGGGVELHVIRVRASGDVVCRDKRFFPSSFSQLAWLANDRIALFRPGRIRVHTLSTNTTDPEIPLPFQGDQFDAVGTGSMVNAGTQCNGVNCTELVMWGNLSQPDSTQLYSQSGMSLHIGPVRIAPSEALVAFESEGIALIPTGPGNGTRIGTLGDRAPAFALHEAAVIFTSDDGQLLYHFLSGAQAGQEVAIPPSWKNVYSPDWASMPSACATETSCF